MSRKEKLIKKFLDCPRSLRYPQIEKLLLYFGFRLAGIKGSHRKFRHPNIRRDLIVPVHGGDCSRRYKHAIAKIIKNKIL